MNKKPNDLIEKYEREKKKLGKKNEKLKKYYKLIKDKWEIDTKDLVKEIEEFIEHFNKDSSYLHRLELIEGNMYIAVSSHTDFKKNFKHFKPHEIEKPP